MRDFEFAIACLAAIHVAGDCSWNGQQAVPRIQLPIKCSRTAAIAAITFELVSASGTGEVHGDHVIADLSATLEVDLA